MESNKLYANSLDTLYANKDMPAPARDAAMQNFLALRNAQANLPALLFGINLDLGAAHTQELGGTTPTGGTVTEPSQPPGTSYYTGPSPDRHADDLSPAGRHGAPAHTMTGYANGQPLGGPLVVSLGRNSCGSGGGSGNDPRSQIR